MKIIAQGAEARIYRKKGTGRADIIVKDRFPKSYRIKEIDEKLRGQRTRREAKILEKLSMAGFPAPKLAHTDDKSLLGMEEIKGKKIRDILAERNCRLLCKEIGEKVASLHNNSIIHGDLTTSNMMQSGKDGKVYILDFGLSFFSEKIEDKAVDLHLLKEALESRHWRIWKECYNAALEGYKEKAKDSDKIIERIKIVEKRGRYKGGS
ncbi:Kae1-associated serine/threonine protein kinase [Candidatus Woesearchaeota archaeon]|nr:Kae1-associated serine/threonine protein kinase [Candidatus Woesearchaeota archaeon]